MQPTKKYPVKRFYLRLLASSVLWCGLVCLAVQGLAAGGKEQRRTQNPEPSQASPEAGRMLFESSCAPCHGLDGRGGERGPDISTRPQMVQLSNQEILGILREGRPAAGMPPFDSFGNAKLRALLSYLRSLQGKGAATALPGDAAKGKALFFGKARCSECHMVQGKGGFLGGDLSVYGASVAAGTIRAKITGTGEETERGNRVIEATLQDGQKLSGVVRNEDNFSVQLQSLDGTFHLLPRSDITKVEASPEPIMPPNYGATLSAEELDDLVKYLATTATPGRRSAKQEREEDSQ